MGYVKYSDSGAVGFVQVIDPVTQQLDRAATHKKIVDEHESSHP
jgi:hypothetical protein